MTRDRLNKRLFRIKATPLNIIPNPIDNNRRGKNYIEINIDERNSYEDFFDFEKDLVELESSRSLASNAYNSKDFFDDDNDDKNISSVLTDTISKKENIKYIVMEELLSESHQHTSGLYLEELDEIEENEDFEKNIFEFIQCTAIKGDGERCKRQAPKGHTTCSIIAHRSQEYSTNKEKVNE